VLHGELHQERLHSQRVELAKGRDVRSEDDVVTVSTFSPDRAMSNLELDHLLVFVDANPPQIGEPNSAGLRETFRRRHLGQGTANVCYCFDNAYLELIWETDRAETSAAPAVRLRLAERAAWPRTDACPFGIAVRKHGTESQLPFDIWEYVPPYRPAGTIIPVAVASDDPRQPLLFCSPGGLRPDSWTDGQAGERQRAAGLTEIKGVRISFPMGIRPDAALTSLAECGLISLRTSDEDRSSMVLTIARMDGGPPRRLSLPKLVWL